MIFLKSRAISLTFYALLMAPSQASNLNPMRRLLCHIRGGDYVHPGEERAIDMVMMQALQYEPSLRDGPVLDVGCGFGGTVNYLARHGFKSIQGIDIDQVGIAYAQATYPQYQFLAGNALQADQYLNNQFFGFITLFSVAYAIEDKRTLFNALGKLAKPGAILAIWDYTCPSGKRDFGLKDTANSLMHPIVPSELRKLLKEAGWDLLAEQDMTDYFGESYVNLLSKLAIQREELTSAFTPEVVQRVCDMYTAIKDGIESGELGGIIMYARKSSIN